MKQLRSIVGVCCVVAVLAALGSEHPAAHDGQNTEASAQARSRVPNAIPLRAESFSLRDVRLLDGPFRDAMVRDQQYLLGLDVDRLLHSFRVTAGLPSTATPLGGWEAPDVELRGHTLGHYLSGLALMYASTGDTRFKDRGTAVVAELAKIQTALAARGFNKGYLSAFPEELIDRVDARQRVWAPYYTLHKMLAGLLDMYELCGNRQALDVLLAQAEWVKFRMDRLSRPQRQAMLMTEHGGMKETLANLYAVTGNPDHLRLSRAFDHDFIFDPLAKAQDRLDGLHANTQIPKIIGAARDYELTGDPRYRDIVIYFWKRVALNRSYANGGHSDDESFFPVDHFSEHLGTSSSETCNTYNMLKLTRHLFSWGPSAEAMDFYEKGLFNHILASQDPATGGVIYYCPFKPGAFKTYSTPNASFWCCVGTGLENHAKYPDSVYFHDASSLYVNLFIPTELTWAEKGLTVRQETTFPESDTTRLSFTAAAPIRLAVKVRFPAWAVNGMTMTVNGTPAPVSTGPGSYVAIERVWKTGDVVQITLPMSLRVEAMPDDPGMVAVLYGPVLLAGDLGKDGLDPARRYGPSAPQLGRMKSPAIPALVSQPGALLAGIKPVAGERLTFKTNGLGQPHDVTLVPFWKTFDIRYTAYWRTYTPADWEGRKAELAMLEARRKEVANLTVDTVDTGSAESETAHHYQGENATQPNFEDRRGREARNGWFSYDVTVMPDRPVTLVCTFRGSEGRRRVFDILVDGEKTATVTLPYHPTELLDMEYAIPEALTRGKQKVTVRFQPHADAATAAVFEVRVVPTAK